MNEYGIRIVFVAGSSLEIDMKIVKIIITELVYGASLILFSCFVFPKIWDVDKFTEKLVCGVVAVETMIHIFKDIIQLQVKNGSSGES